MNASDEETPLALAKRTLAHNGTSSEDGPRLRRHLSSIRHSMVFLSILAGIAALWVARDFLLPLSLAVMLALILGPVVSTLERLRFPKGLASLMVVLMAMASLFACALIVEPSVTDMVKRAPEIASSIEKKIRPLKQSLGSLEEASNQLDNLAQMGQAASGPSTAAPYAPGFLEGVPNFLAQVLFVFVVTVFALSARTTYRKRIIMLSSKRETRLRIARILSEVSSQVSEYLLAITLINIGLGIATAAAFALAGIPDPLVWGLIFAVANYIPYVGPTGTMLVCALVQIVVTDSLVTALIAPGILFVLNLIESDLVTPWFVSRKISVSALAVFLAVALLIWLWGVAAAFIAVPMLILFNAIARHVPTLEPIAYLLSGEGSDSRQQANIARDGSLVGKPTLGTWWRQMRPGWFFP